jgi:hypothetical protein
MGLVEPAEKLGRLALQGGRKHPLAQRRTKHTGAEEIRTARRGGTQLAAAMRLSNLLSHTGPDAPLARVCGIGQVFVDRPRYSAVHIEVLGYNQLRPGGSGNPLDDCRL